MSEGENRYPHQRCLSQLDSSLGLRHECVLKAGHEGEHRAYSPVVRDGKRTRVEWSDAQAVQQ